MAYITPCIATLTNALYLPGRPEDRASAASGKIFTHDGALRGTADAYLRNAWNTMANIKLCGALWPPRLYLSMESDCLVGISPSTSP